LRGPTGGRAVDGSGGGAAFSYALNKSPKYILTDGLWRYQRTGKKMKKAGKRPITAKIRAIVLARGFPFIIPYPAYSSRTPITAKKPDTPTPTVKETIANRKNTIAPRNSKAAMTTSPMGRFTLLLGSILINFKC
jgi:hypothetical protein